MVLGRQLKTAIILLIILMMLTLPTYAHTLTLPAKYPDLEFKDPITNSEFEYSNGWVVEKGSAGATSSYSFKSSKSWHISTSGGQFSLYQTLSENVESYIKGKNIQFSFWFKPEQTNGEIYAQIKYKTTRLRTSYIYTWNGNHYIKDNNLLRNFEKKGQDVNDYYILRENLVEEDRKYLIMIKEDGHEKTWIDQIKLISVDHEENIKIGVTQNGEIITYGEPISPLNCTDKYGNNFLGLIREVDEWYFESRPENPLTLNFRKINSTKAKLIIRTCYGTDIDYEQQKIKVQILDSNGQWLDVEEIRPRVSWAMETLDLSKYLGNVEGNLTVRLVFTWRNIKIDYIALDTTKQGNLETNICDLLSATYMSKENVKFKLMYPDNRRVKISSGEYIKLEFEVPQQKYGERNLLLYVKGRYGDPIYYWVTITGDKIYPESTDRWYNAFVKGYISSRALEIRVYMRGTINGYVDTAQLEIIDYTTTNTAKGYLSLSTSVYSCDTDPNEVLVKMGIGCYVQSSDPSVYAIRSVELKAEFVSLSSSQDALLIFGPTQANEDGYEIDPKEVDERWERGVRTAEIAIIIAGTALGFGTILLSEMAVIHTLEVASLAVQGTEGLLFILDYTRTECDKWSAQGGGDVHEIWNYPVSSYSASNFVSKASGAFEELTWVIRYPQPSNSYQINLSVTVEWGKIYFIPYQNVYILSAAGTTTITIPIIVTYK